MFLGSNFVFVFHYKLQPLLFGINWRTDNNNGVFQKTGNFEKEKCPGMILWVSN